jgi:3-hydroxyisobutyrate dehydrogenase-like beta-hydroxyacid dehydrogenase
MIFMDDWEEDCHQALADVCSCNMNKPLTGYKIGFVGLGNMGRANARHLHEARAEVIVWNRSDGPAAAAVALGMKRAASLPELAREIGRGIICINLTMTDVVEKVVFGDHRLWHYGSA